MNVLHILILCGISEPKSGCQNRVLNLTRLFKRGGHNIILLEPNTFFSENDNDYGLVYYYNDLKLSSWTISLSKDVNFNFLRRIHEIIKYNEVDLIVTNHPSGVMGMKFINFLSGNKIPIIYDAQNVESDFTKEIFNQDNYSLLKKKIIPIYVSFLERIACKYLVDHINSVSSKDKQIFLEKYNLKKEKISVIPSGCCIKNIYSKEEKENLRKKFHINEDVLVIVFHGHYSHNPNQEAFDLIKNDIAPKFERDNVIFLVGGNGVPIFETSNVISVGFIDNLWEFMSIADMAIVPIKRGGGTKIKVLDYLSSGLPIITTKKGIEGIDAKNNEDLIIVDDVNDDFINKISFLLNNNYERKRLGENARKLAERKYDWQIIGDKLNKVLKEI